MLTFFFSLNLTKFTAHFLKIDSTASNILLPPFFKYVYAICNPNFANLIRLHLCLTSTLNFSSLIIRNIHHYHHSKLYGEIMDEIVVPNCCCQEVTILRTSWTDSNPGRRFFWLSTIWGKLIISWVYILDFFLFLCLICCGPINV